MELLQQTIRNIPPVAHQAAAAVKRRFDRLTKPQGSLGELETLVANYAGMTGEQMPSIPRKAMVLMAGDHGVAVHGVSAYPQEVTVQMVYNYLSGGAGANVLARHAGADMFIVDVGVRVDLKEHPRIINRKIAYGTEDFTRGPAMTREQAVKGLEVGIEIANMCIDQGYGLFALAEMGIGNTTATAAIASVFTGLSPEQAVGRGSGIGDGRLKIKQQVVQQALLVNKPNRGDALDVLSKIGGYDIAGLAGVILGGAARRVPTVIDGVIATGAALIAAGLAPEARNYMIGSHLSAEPAHGKMLEVLGLRAVLDMGMRLGEGTGACLAMTLLDAGIKLLRDMATFEEAGIATAEPR
ncbi:nicotinate-nucleotide--dimethylbenzimidazole phosphoribosyltransferase [Sporolituus thermophilus]|uniref:Nicotinate-nucleotide--dimethylbenzimidazole phosphoribosyltransferase n=1 Tax=Sporolituus thermophilus DSM 23256 TaxID=1123285 RepID=A0A1G7I560_9FIRM|nr:nicotinate-nucleotide--dimethylbenzimidazole phosphoribosyltransferase [Sporolituus thermophilus]SDF07646.1 nicotinate-nucleotide-dimethylbenzimidazole phosphoribosyltransferase [Sporolituus thermophilus DSM 23256]